MTTEGRETALASPGPESSSKEARPAKGWIGDPKKPEQTPLFMILQGMGVSNVAKEQLRLGLIGALPTTETTDS